MKIFKFVLASLLAQPFMLASASDTPHFQRATEFVVAVAVRDLNDSRSGKPHVFTHARDQTESALRASINRWLLGTDSAALVMTPIDRQTLFAFYWAAQRLPAESACFKDIGDASCEHDLGPWLREVQRDNPDFISAYRASQQRLGLPPVIVQAP
jgi:hypothetical protein